MKNKTPIAIIIGAVIIGIFIFSGFLFTGRVIDDRKQIPESIIEFDSNGVVTKVIDGDTVIINGESVRLLGMDADEKGYPCYTSAKERIEALILSKNVNLEKDVEDKDQYQRYLRYIFLNGKNINLQMVEEGLAVARFSPENTKYKTEILSAEKDARENKKGCKWGEIQNINVPESSEIQWKTLSGEAIGACNAGNYIGQEKIVEGRVVDIYKSKTNTLFINLEKPYPNSCFTAVVFSSNLYKFPEDYENYFNGKLVRFKGEIKLYEGKPEIILESMSQVEVAD